MGKIKFIVDGNFPRWFRLTLITIGFALIFCTVRFIEPTVWSGLLLLIVLGIAAVGGFTSRAALLKIKPFDNSYKKARDSYKTKDDKRNEKK